MIGVNRFAAARLVATTSRPVVIRQASTARGRSDRDRGQLVGQSCHARRATQYIVQTGQIVRDPAFGQYSAVLVDEREVMVAIAASTGPKPITKGRRDDRFAHKSPSWAWPRK
jgi:hypothetical protein